MGLRDLFRPEWRHSDPERRLRAVEKAPSSRLAEIAFNDSDAKIRVAAIQRISDQRIIANLAASGTFDSLREKALELLTDTEAFLSVAHWVRPDSESKVSQLIENKVSQLIENGDQLKMLALHHECESIRRGAIAAIRDDDPFLVSLAKNCDAERWREGKYAVDAIKDTRSLTILAGQAHTEQVRACAATRLREQQEKQRQQKREQQEKQRQQKREQQEKQRQQEREQQEKQREQQLQFSQGIMLSLQYDGKSARENFLATDPWRRVYDWVKSTFDVALQPVFKTVGELAAGRRYVVLDEALLIDERHRHEYHDGAVCMGCQTGTAVRRCSCGAQYCPGCCGWQED